MESFLPTPLVGDRAIPSLRVEPAGPAPAGSFLSEVFIPDPGFLTRSISTACSHRLHRFLSEGVALRASDVEFMASWATFFHISSGITVSEDVTPLSQREVLALIAELVRWKYGQPLEHDHPLFLRALSEIEESVLTTNTAEFSTTPFQVRLRVHLSLSLSGLGATIRFVAQQPPQLHGLGLPPDVVNSILTMLNRKSGFALITGPTGSGKSTTLAALIDHIRKTAPRKIITVEDPIEIIYHDPQRAFPGRVVQKEVGTHIASFDRALHSALRERPDLIVMQELRNEESAVACLNATQTGHLILATLHTRDTLSALRRLTEILPKQLPDSVMRSCSESLLFVLCQGLLQRSDGDRQLAIEFFQNRDHGTKAAIASAMRDSALLRNTLQKPQHIAWNNFVEKLRANGTISDDVLRDAKLHDDSIRLT